jgi:hypothetical protein
MVIYSSLNIDNNKNKYFYYLDINKYNKIKYMKNKQT